MKYLITFLLIAILGCKSSHNVSGPNENLPAFVPQFTPGPQALVYKTKSDYYHLVPVILNDDGTEIVSYPHPADLSNGDGFLVPLKLANDYLLDNRGINGNIAFISLTYQEYSNLNSPPSLNELYELIIDKDPLTELFDCGNKTAFTDVENQLNQLIESDQLKATCKRIK